MKYTVVLVIALGLVSCSGLHTNQQSIPEISISIEGQDRIRFSGKGAGAGMMMASSMGATGIAIGVAIDEGIAKDIQDAYTGSGGNFSYLLETEIKSWLSLHCEASKSDIYETCLEESLDVTVYRYGFETSSGENDPVRPDLDFGFKFSEQEIRLNLKGADLDDVLIPLELAKEDGKAVEISLKIGVQRMLQQLETQL